MLSSNGLKGKTILAFVSGMLVALILSGTWWYFLDSQRTPTGPMSIPTQAEKAGEMPGMLMSGPPKAEERMERMKEQSSTPGGLGQALGQATVVVSPARRQLIGVKTDVVQERALETVIRMVGTVNYDERRIRQINLRISGWITHLFVDYTGKPVKKGDPLFTIYSPDLISTQEEYLLARKTLDRVKASPVVHVRTGAEAQVESARNRLLLWNLTEEQIAELERRERPQVETTIFSPIEGVVTKKTALQGMYVTPEMNLYEIADLSVVWIQGDIYEYEVPWVKMGQVATVTLASYPGRIFQGQVVYLYPYLNSETRTLTLRIELPNPAGLLKPGMYGNVEIRVKTGKKLAIPQEAVIDSGIRKLAFIDRGQGVYEPREVILGPRLDHYYEVLGGLNMGDRVVTSATFLIDSESKLMAAASMMGMLGMGGVKMEQARMGEMQMGDMKGEKGMEGMEGMDEDEGLTAHEQTVDGLTLVLAAFPEPPKKGENVLHLTVRSKETPVTNAKVIFSYTMAMPGMEVEMVEAKHTKGGIYSATVNFGMKGAWNIDVTIVQGKANPVKARFSVVVGK